MNVRKIIALCCIVVLTIVVGYLAVTGVAWGIYEIRPLHEQIPRGLDLTGGVSVVYEAKDLADENLDVNIESVISSMRVRLDAEGYTEATVVRQGIGRIRIEIPINETNMVDDPAEITQYLVQPALIEFVDPNGEVLFTGADMEQVAATTSTEGSGYEVAFRLNEEATAIFAQATAKFERQVISIRLDGTNISMPTVDAIIPNGQAVITGDFTAEQASQLANQIRSGALPIEMEEIEVRSVSATLGEEALERSVIAGLIGLLLVFLFMIVFYRVPGLISVLALSIYMILMLFCLATIPGVQLTLPGVAGIILSIGMAVDANVIIFERMREEILNDKSVRTSVKTGFERAFAAIMDGNITTILAALVLLLFGTGTIKGFAITLLIGIILSFFTAVLITRGLMNLVLGFHFKNKAFFCPMPKLDENGKPVERKKLFENFSFSDKFRRMIIAPVAVLLVGLIVTLFAGGLNVGVDFTGGTLFTVDLKADFETGVIDDALAAHDVLEAQVIRTGLTTANQTMVDIRMRSSNDDASESQLRMDILETIQASYPQAEITSVDRVDGIASIDLIRNALLSIAIAGALILVYIWFRFELLSGVAAVVALLHDVAVMLALTCILRVPINSPFIAAVLTIVGYSINNTIVVFDRVRENRKRDIHADKHTLEIVDRSIRQSLTRSINTTITTLLTITMVFLLGVDSIRQFALPIIVGLLAGTYSSIFLAAPMWANWQVARTGKSPKAKRA